MNSSDDFFDQLLNGFSVDVKIPQGEYQITRPIVVPETVRRIDMYGVEISVNFKNFAGESAVILHGSPKYRFGPCTIVGLHLTGSGRDMIGIQSSYSRRLKLTDVVVSRFQGHGVLIENAYDFIARDIWVYRCGSTVAPAMVLRGDGSPDGSYTSTLDNVTVEAFTGIGLYAERQESMRLVACKFHGLKKEVGGSMLGVKFVACRHVRNIAPLYAVLPETSDDKDCSDFEQSCRAIDRTRKLS